MKIFTKNNIFKFFLIIISLSFFANAFASNNSNAEDVRQYIDNFGNQVITIAGDKRYSLEYRRMQLTILIDSVVDSNWMSRFVLARHYRTANPEQKERFKRLYRQFMINTYSPRFEGYNGEKFEIIDVVNRGKYYIVKCVFIPKDKPEINIDFRVRNSNNSGFVILDIMAKGVSLIATQRSVFGSQISNGSLDDFLDDLENRVEKLKLKNSSAFL